MVNLETFVKSSGQFVVAHRGSSGTAPENTISAFRLAVEAGAAMVETDIQFTADKRIISFHDFYLDRTSSGKGLTGSYDFDELKEFDAGAWFDDKFSGERIPLVEDVIDVINGYAYLNIEIKSYDKNDAEEKISRLVETIYRKKYEQNTLFSSFDYNMLSLLKNKYPLFHTAAIKIPGDKRLPSELAALLGCEAYVCSIDEINNEISEDAEKNSLYIGVYSVDTIEDLNFIKQFNIQAIVTNFPARIINELKQK